MSSASPSSSSDSPIICTLSKCTDDQDTDVLKCYKCLRQVHYRCTSLPAYQIQVFIKKRTNKFECQNCVEVDSKLLVLVPIKERHHPSLKTEKEIEGLRLNIKCCENVINKQKEKQKELKKTIKEKEADLTEIKKELQTNPGYHTLEYIEDKFEKKLESFRDQMAIAIKDSCSNAVKSYAEVTKSDDDGSEQSAVKTTTDLQNAIKSIRGDEIAEEMNQRRRSRNLIIHGVSEDVSDAKKWSSDLVDDLHVNVTIKWVSRIGAKIKGKTRPLLLGLENEEEKEKMLGNLKALKGIEKYKGISIMEDLTPEQRNTIKKLSSEAKTLNAKETSVVWRVRGSSKNGFFLKKMKRNASTYQQ